MADQPFDAEAYVAAAAAAIDLPIPEQLKAGVAEQMRATHRLAQVVMAQPLDDTVEAAPVFRA